MYGSDGMMRATRKDALNRWRRHWAYIPLKHMKERKQGVSGVQDGSSW